MPNGIPDDLIPIPNDLVPVGAAPATNKVPTDLIPVGKAPQQESLQDTANRFLSAQQATNKLPFDNWPSQQQDKGPALVPAKDGVKEQYDSPDNLETNVTGEEQLARAARRGLEGNLGFKAAQLVGKALTGQTLGATPADQQASLNRYSFIFGLSQFADPAGLGIFKGAEKYVAAPILDKMGMGESYKALLNSFKAESPAAAHAAVDNAVTSTRSFANELFKQKLATAAVAGGAGMGAYDTAQEGADQALQGQFDPTKLVEAAGKGVAKGVAFSSALVGAASALQKASAVASALKTGKAEQAVGLDNLNVPTKTEAFNDAFENALQHVRISGIPPERQLFELRGRFLENLENEGVKLTEQNAGLSPVANTFSRQSEKFSYFDKTLGTDTYDVFHNFRSAEFNQDSIKLAQQKRFTAPLQTLYKNGVSPQEAYHLLSYVEDAPNGDIVFNPTARNSGGNVRVAYPFDPPAPGSPVMTALQELRHNLTSMLVENPEFAEKTGYVPGYVPLMNKQTGEFQFPKDTSKIAEPGIIQPRTSGAFDPAVHEDNLGVVLNRYINQYARHTAYNQHLDGLFNELVKLKAVGQDDAASELANMAMSSMGVKQKADLAGMFSDKFLADHGDILNSIAKKFPQPDSFLDSATKLVRDQAYKQYVFNNPMIMLRHAVQPEMVAGGEIGPQWVAAGRTGWLSKEYRDLANQAMPLMKSPEAGLLDKVSFEPGDPNGLSPKGKIRSLLNAPSKVGQKILNAQDTYNRQVVFIGAYRQFKNAFEKGGNAAADAVLDGLNYGERGLVRKAFKQSGPEAAAQMYGVTRALRAQYAYALADTPNGFREGLGSMIPFTTWGSNQLMRFAGDVEGGNYAQLAKRIVLPLLYADAMKRFTGYEIPKSNPAHAIPQALGGQAIPFAQDIVKSTAEGNVGKVADAAINLTPAGPALRMMQAYKRSSGDLGATLGLRKAPKTQQKPDFYKNFVPKTIKRLLQRPN